ncbi:MAG: acetyltransferase-like isoleucine patch superfamily enzyme [bacterium]|jgi:acetyltransferase-like isoleucine patch superfamily enzyme
MASLSYLWSNRVKFPISSIAFYKCWAKRVLCMPELIKRNKRRSVLINEGASIDATAEIGEVSFILSRKNLTIGAFSFIGKAQITLRGEVNIGNNVCISDNVKIITGSHDVSDPQWGYVKGRVIIEDYVWIATDAIILSNVHIGRGAVIGAGAVVSKNVAAGSIMVGNPAKPITKVRCEELNYNPCEFLAANNAWLK